MPARRVLYLDSGGLRAWHRHGGEMHAEAAFAAVGRDFSAYLERHRRSHFYVLVDVADEEFDIDDIPAVGRRDRRAIIERRLAQRHLGTPLKAALSCGRLREGRCDERLLLAALSDWRALSPWLEAVGRAQAALVGVFSTAQLAGLLPCVHGSDPAHVLVVNRTRAGLRQTFLERGQLRFSRLTWLASDAEAAAVCAREALRVRQYLTGRTLVEGGRLAALVLAPAAEAAAYRAGCADSAELRFEFHDLDEEAARSGLRSGHDGVTSEALFAHLLLRRTPAAQFAGDDRRRMWRLARADALARGVGGGLLAACLTFAGAQAAEAYRLRQETESLRAELHGATQTYAARVQSLPASPLAPHRLRAVVSRYDDLRRRSSAPGPAYRLLGAALTDFPQVAVERLEWRLAERSGGDAILDLHAALPPELAGDPRGQLAVIEALAGRLRVHPAVEARATSRSFDAEPDKALNSDVVATAGPPRFVLRTRLKRLP